MFNCLIERQLRGKDDGLAEGADRTGLNRLSNGSAGWSQSRKSVVPIREIGWVLSEEIRWSQSEEIAHSCKIRVR